MKHPIVLSASIISTIVVLYVTGYAAIDTYLLENPDQKFGAKGGVQFAFMVSIFGAVVYSIFTSIVFYILWRPSSPGVWFVIFVSIVTGLILAILVKHISSNTPFFLFRVFGDFAVVLCAALLSSVVAVSTNFIGDKLSCSSARFT